MKYKTYLWGALVWVLVPATVGASNHLESDTTNIFSGGGGGGNTDTIGGILNMIATDILNPLAGVLVALALVVFFIGMVKYLRSAGEDDKSNAKQIMWWGIIALFVMVSVWGLVGILINTFFAGGLPSAPPSPSF